MRHRATLGVVLMALGMALFALPARAHAYLDPGTGSYFFQLALAAIVGALFAVRLFWSRIKAFLWHLFSREQGKEQDAD